MSDFIAGILIGFPIGIIVYGLYAAIGRMIMRQKIRDRLDDFLRDQKDDGDKFRDGWNYND